MYQEVTDCECPDFEETGRDLFSPHPRTFDSRLEPFGENPTVEGLPVPMVFPILNVLS